MIEVTYIYHSGFCVETKDYYYIFDYYKGNLPVLDKRKKVYVFASHFHQDHYNLEVFKLLEEQGIPRENIEAVLSADIRKRRYPEGIQVLRVSGNKSYTLSNGAVAETLRSTDSGVAFLLTTEDGVIYHAGDLNDWVWEEESDTYNENMTRRYRQEIDRIKGRKVDVAFLPLDVRQEKDYARGILYFIEEVPAKHIYPMHYWGHSEVIEQFCREYPEYCNQIRNTEEKNGKGKIAPVLMALVLIVCVCVPGLSGCGEKVTGETEIVSQETNITAREGEKNENAENAVDFEHELDEYQPVKEEYNFYFTYKTIHPWWDAVGLGIEDAAKQYEERGIVINYEYLAPDNVSAKDQTERLSDASRRNFDVIGVDVADVEAVTPAINALVEDGHKIMTFSSSDAAKEDGCKRIAYVGNTHNYEDGAELTEALCEKLGYKGKIAVLVGTKGAPCHEDRALGVQDVIAKYADMEIAEVAYDEDSVDKAYQFTREFLSEHGDLAGIVCCNMSNPVGAARAVIEAGRDDEIVIVGMDHDQEALHYLRDGSIYALGVQDCYSIGFDTVQVAVKVADGLLPGDAYPEKTEEKTTIIYQDGAASMLRTLYGEID